ncbi:MAG: restriction endonuclease, partial [Rhodoglobus sp.]
MEFTRSFQAAVGDAVRDRYELLEVRNAAAILQATNPARMAQVEDVLNGFSVLTTDLLTQGGQETALAAR